MVDESAGDAVANVVDAQHRAGVDSLMVGGLAEQERQDPKVDQVLGVDPGIGRGDHRPQAEERGNERPVLTGGSLAVVLAADDEVARVLAQLERALVGLLVDLAEVVLGEGGSWSAGSGPSRRA